MNADWRSLDGTPHGAEWEGRDVATSRPRFEASPWTPAYRRAVRRRCWFSVGLLSFVFVALLTGLL